LERRSIYRAAQQAALASAMASVPAPRDELTENQAYQSELAAAVGQWNRDEWWRWVSRRILEHVRGEVFWLELGRTSFASVTGENPERGKVLEDVLALESGLDDPALENFDRRRRTMAEWAGLLNRLLDA
jgi:hypothetical protein